MIRLLLCSVAFFPFFGWSVELNTINLKNDQAFSHLKGDSDIGVVVVVKMDDMPFIEFAKRKNGRETVTIKEPLSEMTRSLEEKERNYSAPSKECLS